MSTPSRIACAALLTEEKLNEVSVVYWRRRSGSVAQHSGPGQPRTRHQEWLYKDVAKKYAGDAGAEARLIKIVKGGSNPAELHWKEVTGGMPMPANAHVADADVKTLVKWVLSQK
ncbi:MAG: cytochrome C [Betaproteobacteria bacterium]|nr:cytochrome C [Betaproteobacteria bacterium]